MTSFFIKNSVLFFVFLLFLGCSGKNSKRGPESVVSVGNRHITFGELKKFFGGSFSDSTVFLNYISGWVEKELLYQAGVSQGLVLDVSIIQKILEYERKIVGEGFLELNMKNLSIDTGLIKNYYNSNNTQFIRKEKEMDAFYVAVNDRSTALKIKKEIRNKPKEQLSHILSKHGGIQKNIRFGEFPEKINSKIFSQANFKQGNLLGPYFVDKKYCLVKIENIYRAGSLMEIGSVYDEIYQRLKNESYSIMYQQLIDSLAFEYPITIDNHKIRRLFNK